MEVFLAQEGPAGSSEAAAALFGRAARLLEEFKGLTALDRHAVPGARVVTIDRALPTGARIAREEATGSWLVAAGTWFHPSARGGNRAERLLEAYLRDPDGVFQALDGYFGIALYDGVRRELVATSDILGCFHLYYRLLEGLALVSTSSFALAALAPTNLDRTSAYEFLTKGTIYEDRTLFDSVRKLEPATLYAFRGGGITRKRRYWRLADLPLDSLEGDRAVHTLSRALLATVDDISHVAARPLCDLTGGYDSRTVVAAFAGASIPFETTVSGEPMDPDVRTAERLAAVIGIPLRRPRRPEDWPRQWYSWATRAHRLTEGEYDMLEYAWILYTHTQGMPHGDMTINGSAGEVARGYWWEVASPFVGLRRSLDAERLARLRYAVADFDPGIFAPEGRIDLTRHFARIVDSACSEVRSARNTTQMDASYLSLRMQRWQGRISSSTTQLWPCISPFACRAPLEAALCTVPGDRKGSRLIGRVLARLHPTLAAVPLSTGYSPIPPALWDLGGHAARGLEFSRRATSKLRRVLGRGREPAVPSGRIHLALLGLWEQDEVRELLDIGRMRARSLYREEGLREFFARSRSPGFAHTGQLGRILTLERTLALQRELGNTGGAVSPGVPPPGEF